MLILWLFSRILASVKPKENVWARVDFLTQSTVNNVNSVLSLNMDIKSDLLRLFTEWLKIQNIKNQEIEEQIDFFKNLLFPKSGVLVQFIDTSNIYSFISELDDYLDWIELEDGMNLKQDISFLFNNDFKINDDLIDLKKRAYKEVIPIIKKELEKIHWMF